MMFLNDITIVITTFYSETKVIECLKSIDNKCKVIVVENSGSKKIKETFKQRKRIAFGALTLISAHFLGQCCVSLFFDDSLFAPGGHTLATYYVKNVQ